jgi:hypothetical protein
MHTPTCETVIRPENIPFEGEDLWLLDGFYTLLLTQVVAPYMTMEDGATQNMRALAQHMTGCYDHAQQKVLLDLFKSRPSTINRCAMLGMKMLTQMNAGSLPDDWDEMKPEIQAVYVETGLGETVYTTVQNILRSMHDHIEHKVLNLMNVMSAVCLAREILLNMDRDTSRTDKVPRSSQQLQSMRDDAVHMAHNFMQTFIDYAVQRLQQSGEFPDITDKQCRGVVVQTLHGLNVKMREFEIGYGAVSLMLIHADMETVEMTVKNGGYMEKFDKLELIILLLLRSHLHSRHELDTHPTPTASKH